MKRLDLVIIPDVQQSQSTGNKSESPHLGSNSTATDSLTVEATKLRQHTSRMEARIAILLDHNKQVGFLHQPITTRCFEWMLYEIETFQLESRLNRLRQLANVESSNVGGTCSTLPPRLSRKEGSANGANGDAAVNTAPGRLAPRKTHCCH